jgi:hypothetical protein
MPLISLPLERAILRRSVSEHADTLDRCVHCHRTPLTGEVVHLYVAGTLERLVCELCRPLRRETPARSELMHAPEHDRSVRVTRRAA